METMGFSAHSSGKIILMITSHSVFCKNGFPFSVFSVIKNLQLIEKDCIENMHITFL
jgi:hypothetical protein